MLDSSFIVDTGIIIPNSVGSIHTSSQPSLFRWFTTILMKQYYVYIMTNRSRTLYTGVTSDLAGRVSQHKQGIGSVFTKKYHINRLVYYETHTDIQNTIAREKQIKGWLRKKKIALIEEQNPDWLDLSADWYD